MKRIFTTICALALVTAGAFPTFAAESPAPSPEPDQSCYHPIKVEEYTYGSFDEPRINKVYQLSLSDDPGLIPTGDFERGGRHFYLLDIIRKDEVRVDTRTHTETVTPSLTWRSWHTSPTEYVFRRRASHGYLHADIPADSRLWRQRILDWRSKAV